MRWGDGLVIGRGFAVVDGHEVRLALALYAD